MAAIIGNTDISNMTSDKDLGNGWLNVGNSSTISMAFSIPAMVMSAIIVFGNLLVVLLVWKDPLKKLRSSPSNRIIVSMAIADLLVGLVVCPLMAYWVWAILHQKNLTSVLKSFFVLTDVSSGHVLLLTVDRVFASVTPLQYRVKVTNRRVCMASIACWAYFILFGCAFGLWEKGYIILIKIFIVQSLLILVSILVLNLVILFAFRKHRKTTAAQDPSTANRHKMLQRERKLSKAIAVVISAFLLCSVPWYIVQFLMYFCTPCSPHLRLLLLGHTVTAALLYANSGVNPFLYAWRLPRYRETFKHFWEKCQERCFSQNSQNENFVCETRL